MDKSKTLYVISTQTDTLISKIIKFYTKAPFSHISLSLDEALENMYSFGRKHPPFALPSGFVHENIQTGLFGMLDYVPCQIYRLAVTDEQYEKVKNLVSSFIKIADEYKFNVIGFAPMAFNKKYQREKHFMCSQFVAFVLSKCGIIQFDKDYSLVRPDDIRTRQELALIYEGNLKQYAK